MGRHWAVLAVLAGLAATPAAAMQQDPALGRYEARAFVTGTDLRSRPAGMAACLADVLVKVSGDPTILTDPRLAALQQHSADYVTDFDYWDRMSGIAHHDEQGSNDRPYNLTVRFDPARIDAALATLGRSVWPDPRPVLLFRVHVTGGRANFDLTRAAPQAGEMRAAIVESAQKYGMRVALPGDPGPADGVALAGTLVLSRQALGWVSTWHLDYGGSGYDWGDSGVDFDEAFRDGIGGAMRILSGHGAPQ